MKDIVVFGKPRAFESYEFEFEERLSISNENTHLEPYLKPQRKHNAILHYFVKESYACFEYYAHTKGFDSDRDGSVFGIGIKSDRDIKLSEAKGNVLVSFYNELAESFLYNHNSFNSQSIINKLRDTEWSDEEQQMLDSVISDIPFTQPDKGILLLVLPNLEEIAKVESKIKEYSDVYIADNFDVFKDSNNSLLLKKSNNQIFTVEDENIVPFKEKKRRDDDKSTGRGFVKENKGNYSNDNGAKNFDRENRDNNGTLPASTTTWWKRIPSIVIGITAVLILAFAGVWLVTKYNLIPQTNKRTAENKNQDKIEKSTPEKNFKATSIQLSPSPNPILGSWDLSPQFLPNESLNTISEIQWKIEGEGKDNVKIEDAVLIVTNRPERDRRVTVITKIDDKELGREIYIIKAKDQVIKDTAKTKSKEIQPRYESVTIHFDKERNINTAFSVNEEIIVTAKSGEDICKGGVWKFEEGLSVEQETDKKTNPITIVPNKSGSFVLSYYYTNNKNEQVKKDVKIQVTP